MAFDDRDPPFVKRGEPIFIEIEEVVVNVLIERDKYPDSELISVGDDDEHE